MGTVESLSGGNSKHDSSSSGRRNHRGNPEYLAYLQSDRWRSLARAVKMRAKGRCEICRRWPGEECAHLTYERIFNEPLSDLLWLCRKCHRELDEGRT